MHVVRHGPVKLGNALSGDCYYLSANENLRARLPQVFLRQLFPIVVRDWWPIEINNSDTFYVPESINNVALHLTFFIIFQMDERYRENVRIRLRQRPPFRDQGLGKGKKRF